MAELTLSNITKRFQDEHGEIIAVDDLSLDIDDGEFLVLVGPSGCGKSTTLRMIAGLETVSEGQMRLDGVPIEGLSPQERDLAMVFQSYALYPHMTVKENMKFGLEEATNMSADEIDSRVEETARMLNIDELLGRKPSELSGGQQQRVALGRAIVRDPQVFLLDEPLANLDAKLRAQMRTELQRLQEDLGVTTIYVTHDQTEAMTMGDRIAVLNDGVLQQVGTPLELYHKPANQFVAGFIGEPSMNFFEMTVADTRLVSDTFEYPLSSDTRDSLGPVTDVVLGIRPEDIELVGDTESPHTFETIVDVVEPKGNENNVYLTIGPNRAEPTTFVATTEGMKSIEEGAKTRVRIPEQAIHIFDAKSGTSLKNRSLTDVEDSELTL
ncbi:ABC transporter ATP-binding protein [Halorussus salinisoli]|uniref:ABC transporter ATP-binding protein n=1 Tax=Halorussus salinisoli TaxID=2558242 RepID=UPI0010C1BA11|nr:ABC transporter ATP-binding protein [Halorussus salinisoli]